MRWLALVLWLAGAFLAGLTAGVERATIDIHSQTREMRIPVLRFEPRGEPRGRALLLHGVTASKEVMLRMGEELAANGFAGVAPDFPGHGASSRKFGDWNEVLSTVAVSSSVDVVVGYSMGGRVAADALRSGALQAGLFVALGSTAAVTSMRTLYLVGEHEELIDVDALRRQGRVVSSWSDHVLEPFDPELVHALGSEVSPTPVKTELWKARLVGGFLMALALPFVLALVPKRDGALVGLVVAVVALATLVLAARSWVGSLPSVARFPQQVVLVLGGTGVSWVAGRIAGALGVSRRATAAHGTGLALSFLATVGLALAGASFLALMAGIGTGVLLAAGGLAFFAESRGGALAGSVAFGVVLGWVLGQWLPLR